MSVVYFLLLVGILVAVHELGHFAAAKLLDIKVLRFSLGFGPALVRVHVGECQGDLTADADHILDARPRRRLARGQRRDPRGVPDA